MTMRTVKVRKNVCEVKIARELGVGRVGDGKSECGNGSEGIGR